MNLKLRNEFKTSGKLNNRPRPLLLRQQPPPLLRPPKLVARAEKEAPPTEPPPLQVRKEENIDLADLEVAMDNEWAAVAAKMENEEIAVEVVNEDTIDSMATAMVVVDLAATDAETEMEDHHLAVWEAE